MQSPGPTELTVCMEQEGNPVQNYLLHWFKLLESNTKQFILGIFKFSKI